MDIDRKKRATERLPHTPLCLAYLESLPFSSYAVQCYSRTEIIVFVLRPGQVALAVSTPVPDKPMNSSPWGPPTKTVSFE